MDILFCPYPLEYFLKRTLLTLSLVAAATAAMAQPASTKPNEKLPGAIAVAVTGGLKLENSFKAPGGLQGWVLSSGVDQNMVVYTSADGTVAIAGNMLDAKGTNLTKQHLEQFAPKPDYSKLWGELEKTTWVSEGAKDGAAKSTIYVFEDANCSFCHLTWKALQPYQKAGLQVRWVPVAFLNRTSYDKAAAVMSAIDPGAAFTARHVNFGAPSTSPEATPEQRAKVETNNKLMQSWGFRGTPAIVYKDAQGNVRTSAGMPSLGTLPTITGLPAQPNTDPELARFK